MRGVIQTAEQVRAWLDGRRTMLRVPITRISGFGPVTEFQPSETPGYDWTFRCPRMLWQDFVDADLLKRCPLGAVGDTLFVKESYRQHKHIGMKFLDEPIATNDLPEYRRIGAGRMSRMLSRVEIVIESILVERLQAISEADAVAEGMTPRPIEPYDCLDDPRDQYALAWDKSNKHHPWASNPWVFAATCRRVKP